MSNLIIFIKLLERILYFQIIQNSQNMSQIVKKCSQCQQPNTELLRCAKCKKVYYCDQQCQKKNWPEHKKICVAPNDLIKNPEIADNKTQKTQQKKEGSLSDFRNLKQIGTGNFSTIFRGQHKQDNQTYAIKQIQKAKLTRLRKQADAYMEKHCLSRLKECPYVVRLYKTFQDDFHLYFQMQCPELGELWDISKTFGVISQQLFKYYASHIVKAMSILHNDYEIVHRDLKPQNVLLNKNHQIKLIDFGTAKDLSRPDIKGSGNGAKGKKVFEHYVGTPNYMAPECIHNKASQKVSDIYSLSGLFYFLKVGSPPFAGGSEYLIFTKSLQKKLPKCRILFSEDLKDLLDRMNQKEMDKRISINQIMKHPYFKDIDFEKLPTYDEACIKINPLEKLLIEQANKIQEQFAKKCDEQLQVRKKIYDVQIKEILEKILQKTPSGYEEQMKEWIYVLDLQCQIMLNIADDVNISFAELVQKQS